MARRRPGLLAAILAAMLLGQTGLRANDSVVSREYQIKAAFLYNFTKFVEWPVSKFRGADDPIVIGVLGHPDLVAELQLITRDRTVNARPILVRAVADPEQASDIHVLFATRAETDRLAVAQPTLEREAVLTVGETSGFARSGGMITFVAEGDNVHFEINVGSAERAQLRISAHLQKLATTVYSGS